MPDLPTLLQSIGEDPDDEARWRALSSWLWDHGRDDEAAAVRVFWPTLRDDLTRVPLEGTLADGPGTRSGWAKRPGRSNRIRSRGREGRPAFVS
jgi:hypothetical protein